MEKIAIVDDDLSLCHFLKRTLVSKGYEVFTFHNGREALEGIKGDCDLILLDIRMPDLNGLEVLKDIKRRFPKMPVIIMTAFGTTSTAIEAIRLGAFDYILKPFELEDIFECLDKGLTAGRLMKRAVAIPTLDAGQEDSDQMVGKCKAMQEVYKMIGQVAESDVTVLIRGESGTGKELVARAIYQHSRRKEGPFLAVNCAAIPETLLESELFGHEKGSFTGANRRRIGKFEQCHEGTILLDEVGDMALTTQAKILRVLQEGVFERIGGNETVKVSVRVLASTHRKLEEMIKQGTFREDLYYRLKIMTILLPPLRDRKEDIRELTEFFFHYYNQQLGTKVFFIDPQLFEKLMAYPWPGNVRELGNIVKRGLILCKGEVMTEREIIFDEDDEVTELGTEKELEALLVKRLTPLFADIQRFWGKSMRANLLEKVERFLIQKALSETKGNQVQAARLLGLSRNTLRSRVEKYHLPT
jgi:two-component system, NtrC family, response regulator AtoC